MKVSEEGNTLFCKLIGSESYSGTRSLWAMGTDIIKERNLYASLQNCAFVSTEDIDKKLTRPFEFMFEMSMLGVGKKKHFILNSYM